MKLLNSVTIKTPNLVGGESVTNYEYATDIKYCPNCSGCNVWVESGEGDYYQGPEYLCIDCDNGFRIPSGIYSNEDSVVRSKLINEQVAKWAMSEEEEK
jgi:hypothetical protein